MTGIFPTGGVGYEQALNTLQNPVLTAGCAPTWNATSRCQPRFDPASQNAMLSEMLNLINACGGAYDCSKLDNMKTAVQCLIAASLFDISACLNKTLPDASAYCSLEQLVLATDANGCKKIARYSKTTSLVASGGNATVVGGTGTARPVDPTNTATFYNRQELENDQNVGAVNYAKLNPNKIAHLDFNVTTACSILCEVSFEQDIVFAPLQNAGAGAASRIAVRRDDGFIITSLPFSNYDLRIPGIILYAFTPGPHSLDFYVIADRPGLPPAQVIFSPGSIVPCVFIRKTVSN